MFPTALTRASNGHVRRILIVALATLLMFTALAVVPGAPLALAGDDEAVPQPADGFTQLAAKPDVTKNKDLGDSCGLDMVLVVDSSGSVGGSEANVKSAFNALLDGLIGTGSRAGVVDFNTNSTVPISSYTDITDATVNQSGGAFKTYIDAYSAGGWTNWQGALKDVRTTFSSPELLVIITDGNPNTTDTSTAGGAGDAALYEAMDEANLIKAGITHILAVGVGSVNENRLKDITDGSSSLVAAPTSANIKQLDVTTSSFGNLEEAMRQLASALCDGSVTVTKRVDGDVASGWSFAALPTADTVDPSNGLTDSNGEVTFSWRLIDPTSTQVTITETLQPGFVFDRYECSDGTKGSTLTTAALAVNQGKNIACTFYNDSVDPDIEVLKEADGWNAAGAKAGSIVDYKFTVTNTGT